MNSFYNRFDGDKMKLYENLNLLVTPESYYLLPLENESVLLHIDRITQEISLRLSESRQMPAQAECIPCFGVLGSIKLLAGNYLIIITERKLVGTLNGHNIWRVGNVEVLPFAKTFLHLTRKREESNKIYVSMVKSIFKCPDFYFSYTYDITHTLQRLHNTSPEFLNIPIFSRADTRFLWNGYLLQQLSTIPDAHKFCVPIIHGFVSINTQTFKYLQSMQPQYKTLIWAVISRRQCGRAGTRLYRRGIDSFGNVANFVETEQIVMYEGAQSSFVQIRGSIPLYWHQLPNLKLKPSPKLIPMEKHSEACRIHFDQIKSEYGDVVIVNLIDHKGREAELEKKFKSTILELGNKSIKYEAYDFHKECKNMQYHKLNTFIAKLSADMDRFSYFLIDSYKHVVSLQEGVFRTNCIDCLDRTNVVQSLIAWRMFLCVIKRMELIKDELEITQGEPEFYSLFQNVWADHADYISIQYAGSGALKTDYTRTGKRSYQGVLRDGYNSLLRYYKNNLKDGFRQDSIDLLLGNYVIRDEECETEDCPVSSAPSWKSLMFQMILYFAIAMFFANTIFPSEYTTSTYLSLIFWGLMVAITLCTIVYYGTEFVDYPKLCSIDFNMKSSYYQR